MHPQFVPLDMLWFRRAFNYTGSIGDFRYRYLMEKDESAIHVSLYTRVCYEAATDRVERDFPWTEEGIAALKDYMQASYERFAATGELPTL